MRRCWVFENRGSSRARVSAMTSMLGGAMLVRPVARSAAWSIARGRLMLGGEILAAEMQLDGGVIPWAVEVLQHHQHCDLRAFRVRRPTFSERMQTCSFAAVCRVA